MGSPSLAPRDVCGDTIVVDMIGKEQGAWRVLVAACSSSALRPQAIILNLVRRAVLEGTWICGASRWPGDGLVHRVRYLEGATPLPHLPPPPSHTRESRGAGEKGRSEG